MTSLNALPAKPFSLLKRHRSCVNPVLHLLLVVVLRHTEFLPQLVDVVAQDLATAPVLLHGTAMISLLSPQCRSLIACQISSTLSKINEVVRQLGTASIRSSWIGQHCRKAAICRRSGPFTSTIVPLPRTIHSQRPTHGMDPHSAQRCPPRLPPIPPNGQFPPDRIMTLGAGKEVDCSVEVVLTCWFFCLPQRHAFYQHPT
jgi:hypothetical protein